MNEKERRLITSYDENQFEDGIDINVICQVLKDVLNDKEIYIPLFFDHSIEEFYEIDAKMKTTDIDLRKINVHELISIYRDNVENPTYNIAKDAPVEIKIYDDKMSLFPHYVHLILKEEKEDITEEIKNKLLINPDNIIIRKTNQQAHKKKTEQAPVTQPHKMFEFKLIIEADGNGNTNEELYAIHINDGGVSYGTDMIAKIREENPDLDLPLSVFNPEVKGLKLKTIEVTVPEEYAIESNAFRGDNIKVMYLYHNYLLHQGCTQLGYDIIKNEEGKPIQVQVYVKLVDEFYKLLI